MSYFSIATATHSNIYPSNYPEVKLQENLDSEIMEVLLQEARDSYDEEIVVELRSDNAEEIESNIERIEAWYRQWMKDNAGEGQ